MIIKVSTVVLAILTICLQLSLWMGDATIASLIQKKQKIEQQMAENDRLILRNQMLSKEVALLKENNDAIESVARSEMGWVKEGETLFILSESED